MDLLLEIMCAQCTCVLSALFHNQDIRVHVHVARSQLQMTQGLEVL